MAAVKIVLRKEVKKDGTSPLAIRITKDRKSSYIYLDYSIRATDWDAPSQRVKKSYSNCTRLNNYLMKKLSEATNSALELETEKAQVSSKAVQQKIKPVAGSSFFAQAQYYLDSLKEEGKFNRFSPDRSRLKYFREFLKGEDIAFSDITIALLERFKVYLKSVMHTSDRSISNSLMVIRSVFSQAIRQGIIDTKYYPFGKGKARIKIPQSIKIGLTPDEVLRLEQIELPVGSFENHARNLWLFSFHFAGMRVSDVLCLRWSDFQNDRLYYSMGKNDKAGSLKVPEKALGILAQYQSQKEHLHDLVFTDLKIVADLNNKFSIQKRTRDVVSRLDKYLQQRIAPLAGIEKKLTMHIARHTFGNISGDRIPIQMLQKLYRHSNITTTIGYQANFIHKDADAALEAVIGF